MTKRLIYFLFVLAFLFSILGVSASENITEETRARSCLNESKFIMDEMANLGFNVIRLNDTLNEAKLVFDSQQDYEQRKKPYNYSKVVIYCEDIKKIRASAIGALDEFAGLMRFYNDSVISGMNTSSIDAIVSDIKNEISSERYENIQVLVAKAYDEIIRTKAAYTNLAIFYDSTAGFFKRFFIEHWAGLSIFVAIVIILYLIYKVQITLFILNRKIEKLKIRKETIKGLIMKIQRDYFQDGRIPEAEYSIKTRKFAELILDIDRQIPLLQEDVARLEKHMQWKFKPKK